MKTIQITDDMYNSLLNISKELNTQDSRGTAMPYFFQIQTDDYIYNQEEGEKVWIADGYDIGTEEEIKEAILECKGWENLPDDVADERYNSLSSFEKEKILTENFYKTYRKKVHNYENAFFTEKAIKEHIRLNNHRYNNPIVYLQYATRNPEMETIMKFLCELAKDKTENGHIILGGEPQ